MKRTKRIIASLKNDERGLASFVIVGVLVILLTLISIGFAKLMNRAQNNSLNNQLSTAANYAAQSGLKDVSASIVKTLQAGGTIPSSTTCVPTDAGLKAVYDSGNLSGDTAQTAKYTCILVNPKPTTLDYQQVPADNSEVVKILPEFTTVKVDKLVFGWQASAGTGNDVLPGTPGPTLPLINQKLWNNNKYQPMLRITLYPIDNSDNILTSSTFFAYPTNQNGAVTIASTNFLSNGATLSARCGGSNNKLPPGQFQGNRDYTCNVMITNLAAVNGGNVKYFYARVTPLYVNADFGIQANYLNNTVPSGVVNVAFLDTQATVDVTAKDGSAVKRMQAKVDLTGVAASGGGSSNGVAAGNHDIAEYGLQSAAAICKRYESTSGFYFQTTTGQACDQSNPVTLPPGPDVTVKASTSSVNTNTPFNVSWNVVVNAPLANCTRTASNGGSSVSVAGWNTANDLTTSGNPSLTISTQGTYTFTEKCTDVIGQSDSDSATVTVSLPPAGQTCQDPSATNFNGPLPCQYPSGGKCTDPSATNFNGPLPCQYPQSVCSDPSATNFGGPLPCQYPSPGGGGTCQDPSATNFNGPLPCQYPGPGGAINVYPVCAWNANNPYCFWDNVGRLGTATTDQCHDGLHDLIECISWNATDSYPGNPNLTHCIVSYPTGLGGSASGNYNQFPPYFGYDGTREAAIPPVNNWWNVTLGWFEQQSYPGGGPFTITVTCYDDLGHSGYGSIQGCIFANQVASCSGPQTCPAGYTGTPPNCVPIPPPPPPPPGNCNSAPYAGGNYPNCYCLYPGGVWPNCQPPPGGGGGGCGINLPGKTELFPEFGFLSFIPYTGFIIC